MELISLQQIYTLSQLETPTAIQAAAAEHSSNTAFGVCSLSHFWLIKQTKQRSGWGT